MDLRPSLQGEEVGLASRFAGIHGVPLHDATPLDILRQNGWSVSAKPLGAQSERVVHLFGVVS